jgi:FAD/FMN-containing dehydrogenase
MLTRRGFLQAAAVAALAPAGCVAPAARRPGARTLVNDVHSALNPTWVERVESPGSVEALQELVRRVRREGRALSIAGGRHAMGGQQFGSDTVLLDVRGLGRILGFDPDRGHLEVEAGIEWPELVSGYLDLQRDVPPGGPLWGIAQKQTGADRLTLGGSLASNIHGRGLTLRPLVQDVESFLLVDAAGELRRCSRTENPELFRLVIGGYGLFGPVAAVTLRLAPRRKLERVVEVIDRDRLMPAFEARIAAGFLYGDFQFAIDPASPDFLRRGVFSCYRPVDPETPIPPGQRELSAEDWGELIRLAHADKARAFDRYVEHYLATSGQLYWSDTHQMSWYLDGYHRLLDRALGAPAPGSEVITEIYVRRPDLAGFLAEVAGDFRRHGVEVIYGTVRLIERDEETFLPWARESWACTVFNLHTMHTPEGRRYSAEAFRRLIDAAVRRGGSYYLTYHRHATREQVAACYPHFIEFLRAKRAHDPDERFQSDWYRHYRRLFGDAL